MYRWVKSCCEGCGCLILELFDSTEQQKHMVHWISVISFDQSFIRTWPVREGGKLTKVYFLLTTEERPAGSRKYFARHIVWIYTQMCTRQGNMGYDQYTVPDDCSCQTYFCCSAFTFANISKHTSMASRVMFSNFFDEQWTQNHPQYLSGLSCDLFSTAFFEIECISSRLSSQYSQLISYQHLNLNYLWTSYTKRA